MKKKITIAIFGILLILIGIGLIVLAYLRFTDIESKEPVQIEDVCNVETEEFDGRKVFLITPKQGETTDTRILYFHGGAYMAQMSEEHWNFIKKLTIDTKSTVIIPDYPLTPKYTYKDVYNMVEPLYKEIVQKVDSKDLVVMGDSAGGGLALGLLEKVSAENLAMPNKTILISPWLDVRLENPKINEVQKEDKELNKEALKVAGLAYAGKDGINSYLVNPIDGDLSKLTNITILTGTSDILNPDVHVLEKKAKEQGFNIDIKEYEKAGHIWIINEKGNQDLINKGYQDLVEIVNGTN